MTCPDENVLVAFAAAKLPPAERIEIERHLDECSMCGMLVAEAAREPESETHRSGETRTAEFERAASSDGEPATSPYRLLRGTMLGRYLVLDRLGSGGLGDVYACYDPELDRRVAIKLLRAAETIAGSAELRLKREAQALARLAHPNVVAVHDVGVHRSRVFVAMELVDGHTLRAWLHLRDRSWQQVRDVMVDAGLGLAAAHAAGMVHRDFKPGNMMVGSDGRVRVLDFGLARAVSADPSKREATDAVPTFQFDGMVTRTGVVLGTPAYMAPEQFSGDAVDGRADQFGFCCTLYEALLRRRPFRGDSFEELLSAIEAGPTLPADARQKIPPWLLRAIVRGLSPDPDDRFETMSELLHALQRDRRSRRFRVMALAGVLVAGGVGVLVGRSFVPLSATERDAIDRLVDEVHVAAARGHFIYPPADAPTELTALGGVEQLEAQGLVVASDHATRLRDELAQILVGLGDRYWERPGGRPFAIEYYAQALVFDPDSERAAQRAVLTSSGQASMRQRASARDFSPAELEAAAPLAALAAAEPNERRERLAAVASRGALSAVVVAQLDQLEPGALDAPLRASGSEATTRGSTPPASASREQAEEASRGDAGASGEDGRSAEPEAGPTDSATSPGPAKSKARDPKAAATAAGAGRRALARGGRKGLATAEEAFHRALEADARHVPAIVGLAEIAFERGHFVRAERLARRAVRVEPRVGGHRILLGDCLRRQLRYSDARAEYEKARGAGHPSAAKRLASLAKLTDSAP